MLFIIDRRRKKRVLWSYQRFQYIQVRFYIPICKDYFKINDKQRIKMPKKGEYAKFKQF